MACGPPPAKKTEPPQYGRDLLSGGLGGGRKAEFGDAVARRPHFPAAQGLLRPPQLEVERFVLFLQVRLRNPVDWRPFAQPGPLRAAGIRFAGCSEAWVRSGCIAAGRSRSAGCAPGTMSGQ